MAHKRYLVLPTDGIRLSDTSARPQAARQLLSRLQPGKKAAVRGLTTELSATVRTASGTGTPEVAAAPSGGRKSAKKKKSAARKSAAKAPAGRLTVVKSLGEDSVKLVSAPEALITA